MPIHECTKHLNGRCANQLLCLCTAGSYRLMATSHTAR